MNMYTTIRTNGKIGRKKKKSENLKLNGFHGDGGIDKKNTNHINGSVPFLVLKLINNLPIMFRTLVLKSPWASP